MRKFPLRIHAAPEGEFGQGFDAIKLNVWNETPTYRDEQQYVRADVADEMFELIQLVHLSFGGGCVITFSDDDIAKFAAVYAAATGGAE